ncbi:MAG: DNA-binding protein HU [uncultured bacterium]|nr:MAG: DNA-binding protein HU [uncultured bacterium]HBD05373.1 DNA-binding protein [Candidatus Uhrbacteria bacterium]
MNKAELANNIAERLNLSKKLAEDMLETFEELVTKALLANEEVTLAGFGTFSARERAGRMGVNPQKPTEKIQIPSVIVPKFKAGKALKDALKGKRGGAQSAPAPASAPAPVQPQPEAPSV